MPKIIVHRASGSQLTIDTRSGEGLRVFLHRATFARDADGVRIVQNKLLGGWFVVRGASQTPLSGKFSSKEEAQQWLSSRGSKDGESSDSTGSFLRPGSHKPETRAKSTPINDDDTEKVKQMIKRKQDLNAKQQRTKLTSAEHNEYLQLHNDLNGKYAELRNKIIKERYA